MAKWHYVKAEQTFGPISDSELKQLIDSRQIGAQDLVWKEGMPDWAAAGTLPGLFPAQAAAVPANEAFAGTDQPSYPSQPAPIPLPYYTPPIAHQQATYAGFWWRFLAHLIDSIIMFATGCLIGVPIAIMAAVGNMDLRALDALLNLVGLVIGWLYFALMESSSWQATLGKRACGLYVTNMDGSRISFGRATARFFGKILSAMILMIGFIMAAFTERKQALHDMLASTLVLRRS